MSVPTATLALAARSEVTRTLRPTQLAAKAASNERAAPLSTATRQLRLAGFMEYALRYSVDLQPERFGDWSPQSNVVGKHPSELFWACIELSVRHPRLITAGRPGLRAPRRF